MVRFAVLAAVVLGSTGCGDLEFPITRTKTFVIETESEACGAFVAQESLDTEEARPYLSKLTDVEVREVKLSITNVNTTGDSVATSMTGKLQVAAPDSSDFVTLIDQGQTAIVLGDIVPLPTVTAPGQALVSQLVGQSPHALTLRAEGCFDQAPAGVELTATITYVLHGRLF